MKIAAYLKQAFRLTSMVFTIQVVMNLLLNKAILFNIIEFSLFVSIVSGLLLFLVEDRETYSNQRMIVNQFIYIGIIFMMIIIGDFFFSWELGVKGLVSNFIIVLLIFFFIKFIMFSNDKKEADEMNQYIQKKKKG
ncbi:DUF3021 domain-containing protein [Candidatus Enterococcus mansonii]|uniref:DUF3021 domain-containing protein n=1 Tax=Candidatus Enterococcus mansonii TaxID=1834181 RepID=A0A242CD09_9ENTE|nr:DUF3021 domain-containing protein [Enterococcus sp. 4G2_DIV0659]OTO08008.1 hypothetical protein A5880_002278 [Enterococcus sp. 4G2_DIV0659]